jgi:hypothetical protein
MARARSRRPGDASCQGHVWLAFVAVHESAVQQKPAAQACGPEHARPHVPPAHVTLPEHEFAPEQVMVVVPESVVTP